MKNKIALSVLLLFTSTTCLIAQVGIGTTEPKAMLDIQSSDSGILIPRVALTATNSQAPIIAPTPENGLMVFNTETDGTAPNNVTPGFYYWEAVPSPGRWIRINSGASTDWSLTGNAGTTAGTNFIGTTDTQDLVIATNGAERMRVLDDAVVVNTPAPLFAGDRFTVLGNAGEFAINGYSSTNGVGIYGENTGTGIGVIGIGANGVQGQSSVATGFGIRAANTNATGTGLLATGTNSIGTFLTSGTGISSVGANGLFALARNATGTGLIGTGNNSTTIVTSANGGGIAGSGTRNGVFGYAGNGAVANANRGNAGGIFILDADNNPATNGTTDGYRANAILAGFDDVNVGLPGGSRDSYFGGYFSGGRQNGTPTYAYVGMRYRTAANGNSDTNTTDFKIIGPGTLSTLINDSQGTPRIMFAPESPEIVFQDYGIGQLVNGQARINLDPILKSALHIDENHPLKVFVTLEGDCNGIYVTDKSANGFTVKELQGGTSNVPFSWQIVANRADTKDVNGNIVSKHVGLRLPIGPSMLEPTKTSLKDSSKEGIIIDKESLLSDNQNDDGNTLSEEQLKEISQKLKTSSKQK